MKLKGTSLFTTQLYVGFTGCHSILSEDHLIEHRSKYFTQLKCHHPAHPNFELTRQPDPPHSENLPSPYQTLVRREVKKLRSDKLPSYNHSILIVSQDGLK